MPAAQRPLRTCRCLQLLPLHPLLLRLLPLLFCLRLFPASARCDSFLFNSQPRPVGLAEARSRRQLLRRCFLPVASPPKLLSLCERLPSNLVVPLPPALFRPSSMPVRLLSRLRLCFPHRLPSRRQAPQVPSSLSKKAPLRTSLRSRLALTPLGQVYLQVRSPLRAKSVKPCRTFYARWIQDSLR